MDKHEASIHVLDLETMVHFIILELIRKGFEGYNLLSNDFHRVIIEVYHDVYQEKFQTTLGEQSIVPRIMLHPAHGDSLSLQDAVKYCVIFYQLGYGRVPKFRNDFDTYFRISPFQIELQQKIAWPDDWEPVAMRNLLIEFANAVVDRIQGKTSVKPETATDQQPTEA